MMGNKKGITLLALVITIVIMLLLAGITLQMAIGENGLVAKSEQAKKEQAKTELYDTVKSSYAALSLRAIRNDKDKPSVEEVFNTADFTDRYNIVGDNITDKKGTVIDTKENVLNIIQGTVGGGFTSGTTPSAEAWPKTVGGVTIQKEDKDKMILKLKVLRKTEVEYAITCRGNETVTHEKIVNIDFGNGISRDITDYGYGRESMEYEPGEYIVKIKKFSDFTTEITEDYEIEILQWGNITEKENEENLVTIPNVSKIYEPEPDRIPVTYLKAKITEIPEWIFSRKVTSKRMSGFDGNESITSIPEGLFKNNVNVADFSRTFRGCTGLTSIPEGLFKNNVNATYFWQTFSDCTGLRSIPEGLFKNNVNATNFVSTFYGCTGLTSIPEGLFKNNVNVINFRFIFYGCTGLPSIPEGLFKNNVNARDCFSTFSDCTGLTNIPGKIIEFGKKVKEKGGNTSNMFGGCTSVSNYNSIPSYLK